jgi:hypothetical protein
MNDKVFEKIIGKFVRQTIVIGNWSMNRILRDHPELQDSDSARELRRLLRELTEEEKHL